MYKSKGLPLRKKKHKNLELGTKDGIHPLSIGYRVVLLGREECVTVRKRSLRGSRGKELFSFLDVVLRKRSSFDLSSIDVITSHIPMVPDLFVKCPYVSYVLFPFVALVAIA